MCAEGALVIDCALFRSLMRGRVDGTYQAGIHYERNNTDMLRMISVAKDKGTDDFDWGAIGLSR